MAKYFAFKKVHLLSRIDLFVTLANHAEQIVAYS